MYFGPFVIYKKKLGEPICFFLYCKNAKNPVHFQICEPTLLCRQEARVGMRIDLANVLATEQTKEKLS